MKLLKRQLCDLWDINCIRKGNKLLWGQFIQFNFPKLFFPSRICLILMIYLRKNLLIDERHHKWKLALTCFCLQNTAFSEIKFYPRDIQNFVHIFLVHLVSLVVDPCKEISSVKLFYCMFTQYPIQNWYVSRSLDVHHCGSWWWCFGHQTHK